MRKTNWTNLILPSLQIFHLVSYWICIFTCVILHTPTPRNLCLSTHYRVALFSSIHHIIYLNVSLAYYSPNSPSPLGANFQNNSWKNFVGYWDRISDLPAKNSTMGNNKNKLNGKFNLYFYCHSSLSLIVFFIFIFCSF